jgi:hypothetical protein
MLSKIKNLSHFLGPHKMLTMLVLPSYAMPFHTTSSFEIKCSRSLYDWSLLVEKMLNGTIISFEINKEKELHHSQSLTSTRNSHRDYLPIYKSRDITSGPLPMQPGVGYCFQPTDLGPGRRSCMHMPGELAYLAILQGSFCSLPSPSVSS